MIVTGQHVTTALELSAGNPSTDLQNLIETPETDELWRATLLLIARPRYHAETADQQRARLMEINRQTAVLYLALAPIWVANHQHLPSVTENDVRAALDRVGETLDRGEWTDPAGFFGQLKSWNPFWYRAVDEAYEDLQEMASRFYCAAIVMSVINKLPEPIEPSPVDIGGDILEHL